MNYKVIPAEPFLKEAKRLKKKYNSFQSDLLELANHLSIRPDLGESLGGNLYKVRMSIKSKGKGKSGGAKIITYLINEKAELYLLSIYDKSEIDAIPVPYLKILADKILKG